MRIEAARVYSVNMLDFTGPKLMTEKELRDILDNELGKIVDSCPLLLDARERLVLAKWLDDTSYSLIAYFDHVKQYREALAEVSK